MLSDAPSRARPGPPIRRERRPAYRPFRAVVSAVRPLSPHFTRVTFRGPELHLFGTDRLDQRVKIVFPGPSGALSDLGADDPAAIDAGAWHARWRALPAEGRSPFRTYTVRDVRPADAEVDVDFVTHPPAADGSLGPAGRWIASAEPGREVILVGPDARSLDSHIGIDWHPGTATRLLLAGDETAVPAICAILESLPDDREVHADVEVPTVADALPVPAAFRSAVRWVPRDGAEHGERLVAAFRAAVTELAGRLDGALAPAAQELEDVDVDTQLLWDSPGDADGGSWYAWIAGEAAAVKALRRHLVSEVGFDRRNVAFMGYWRRGRAEAQE